MAKQKTSDRVFAATADIWESYYQHPFVQGIKDGTLEKEKFIHYIIQDYLYLVDYTRIFALGAAKAPDVETMRFLVDCQKGIVDGELNLHNGYAPKLGITQEQLDTTPMSINNASYVAYMLRVAYEEDLAGIMAAILSCAVSYEKIGKRMAAEAPESMEHPLYGDWVTEYASEAYASYNGLMIDLLDRLTEDFGEEKLQHIEDIFVNCSRFEKAFWDMGWEMSM